ncbi:homeobox protein goosecoid [Exaiptasia diaphana]|uniref:Homeobox domain-containing protein n=1 Tax=Exaiptasia diaphana TaxID=2652724 RepID=A0A913XL94_EXADI|nr:homeobox protein goosecoid [Exaiptasia diaphana]KXJ11118.1 Homeobox protein goosecoid [Exaiptasia diaphana]
MDYKSYSNQRSRSLHQRRKTIFSSKQLKRLEEVFQQNVFPGIHIREQLSDELGIREDRIQVWFQNRRARLRRQNRSSSSESFDCTMYTPTMPSCRYPYDIPQFTYHWDSLPVEPAPRLFHFPSEFTDKIQPISLPDSKTDSCQPSNTTYRLTHHYMLETAAFGVRVFQRQQ